MKKTLAQAWREMNQGTKNETGGYLIPPAYYVPKKGLIAYVKRLLKIESGWERVDLYAEILAGFASTKVR